MAKHGVSHTLAIILIIAAIIYSAIADFEENDVKKQKSTKKQADFEENDVKKQKSTKKQGAEFNHTVIHDHEKPWNPIFDDAYDLKACLDKCEKAYDKSLTKRSAGRWTRCRTLCRKLHKCIEQCNEHYGNEEESKICIEIYCNQRSFYNKEIPPRLKNKRTYFIINRKYFIYFILFYFFEFVF
ncbi:hypothetical protein PIB30_085507 [Stylosanthes scabra]|uniref:Transmembrane protein n=1 Tax=Stylosanthes scabra TaxID=79078 RepID=A0ABU6QTD5_9FABA|nr:hypothetical protein [Stylosanthes scabra]